MSNFHFEIGQPVAISVSGEQGFVQGRAEYAFSENQYLVRYKAVDGNATEAWWAQSALEPVVKI